MKKIIEFSAPWCAPCKMIAKIVEELAETYRDKINIVTYGVEEYGDMASDYNVHNVPTFIYLDEDGKEIDRKSGALTKNAIVDFILKHLNE